MAIDVAPEIELLLKEKLSQGEYQSIDELLQAALDALETRQAQKEELRAKLQVGLEQLENGHYRTLGEDGVKSVFAKAKEQWSQQQGS
jgi:Arc/MetJ-type ribon-helix-helix transcriptional regulator